VEQGHPGASVIDSASELGRGHRTGVVVGPQRGLGGTQLGREQPAQHPFQGGAAQPAQVDGDRPAQADRDSPTQVDGLAPGRRRAVLRQPLVGVGAHVLDGHRRVTEGVGREPPVDGLDGTAVLALPEEPSNLRQVLGGLTGLRTGRMRHEAHCPA
jgi:hypothetical protein